MPPSSRFQRTLTDLQSTELEVLTLLHRSTNGDGWSVSTSWLSSAEAAPSHCSWFGITCTSSGNVETIELSGNNLRGGVPLRALVRMPFIKVLKLDGNDVDTAISLEGVDATLWEGTIFDSSSDSVASSLEYLDISHTSLLTSSLSSLLTSYLIHPDGPSSSDTVSIMYPYLNDLYITDCSISAFPTSNDWDAFPSLERLVANDNGMRGTIPRHFAMANLRVFSADNNNLSGSLDGLGELEKLRHVSLRGNSFNGIIPERLTCATNMGPKSLEILDLSHQRLPDWSSNNSTAGLTGKLPSFSQCEYLRRLDLSRNHLSGSIPPEFLKNIDPLVIEGVMLNSNQITGTLPSILARFDVDAVSIQDNKITGVETELCNEGRSGAVAAFGCDAILCRPGTYHPGSGRQEEAGEGCKPCVEREYWGGISCDGESSDSSMGPTLPSLTVVGLPKSQVEQKAILMQLFESTDGHEWTNSYGWNGDETVTICDWYGVICSLGTSNVEVLDLSSNNLRGRATTSIFHLSTLKSLILRDNDILSSSAADFFADIGRATVLEHLDLGSTGLSSVSGITSAQDSLEELHLDSNPFDSSTIPNEIFLLKKLRTLTIDDCDLSGVIESSIYLLSKLVVFSASNNNLHGSLPPEISHLESLSTLTLQNNKFFGTIPSSYNLMESLTTVDFSGQRRDGNPGLEGPLREFAEMPYLTRLDLSANSLTGPVPGFFLAAVDPESFEFVDLSDNRLVSFPIGLAPIVSKVYLQQNQISSIQDICNFQTKQSDSEFRGCDEILCAPGTYNAIGRSRSQEDECSVCDVSESARYFGSVACDEITVLTAQDALELIFSTCKGPDWISRKNWMSDSVPVCQWEGITCSETGSITDISLRSNGLSGMFPSKEVFRVLPSLNSLALEGNYINFDFSLIEGSPSLAGLDLTNTNIQSLTAVDKLLRLSEFYASSNNLRGSFPQELLKLSYLERLDLSFNGFDGTLPDEIGYALRRLELLALHHNSLSGGLPSSLGEMTSLRYLQMESNQFTGTLPVKLTALSQLVALDLSDQTSLGGGLSGSLPSFSTLALKTLDLSDNKLQSTVPSDFLASVDTNDYDRLDLSSNLLEGELPGSLNRFPLSNMIDFSDNHITGIASDLCKDDCAMVLCAPTTYSKLGRQQSESEFCQHCPRAIYWGATTCPGLTPTKQPISLSEGAISAGLSLSETEADQLQSIYESCEGDRWFHSDNWMSSESLCSWYGVTCNEAGSVESIVLSANNLLGAFPSNTFLLPNLKTLALDSNDLEFNFSSIKYSNELANLDLSNTGLFSLDGIQNAPKLLSIDISRNDFMGSVPLEVFQIMTLQQLFIGSNEFQSSIPSSIGDLKGLKLFSCSSSNLSGLIPKSFGNLKELVHLNLEDNHLSGTLPIELESLESLTFLDLSGQSLQGPLLSFKSLRNLRRLDMSRNSFSGTIPDDFLGGVNPLFFDYVDLSENYLTGEVPSILSHFDTIYLQDNQFSAIDSELCDKSRGGVFRQFGCDAILCPPGTFSIIGRQDSEVHQCEECMDSPYFGATSCNGTLTANAPAETLELLPSDVAHEIQALSIFYHECAGDYWNDNTHWMDNRLSYCHWSGIECHNGTRSVKSISIGSNNVRGTPPQELFQLLPNLNGLTLNSNPLDSFNFHWLEDAKRLTDLNLDATRLVSIDGIESSPSLRRLSLRSNSLSGPFPAKLFDVKTLRSLIIGHNDFTGQIPTNFERLSYLETLILNDNKFEGQLNELSFPRTIKLLDLSHNLLTGNIPADFLENIPSSVHLNLDLSDNLITSINQSVCSKPNWNHGDVGKYGCNAILCPSEYYSSNGRHSSLGECIYCPSSSYFGSTECPEHRGPGAKLWAPLVLGIAIALGLLLVAVKRKGQSRQEFQALQDTAALEPNDDACIT